MNEPAKIITPEGSKVSAEARKEGFVISNNHGDHVGFEWDQLHNLIYLAIELLRNHPSANTPEFIAVYDRRTDGGDHADYGETCILDDHLTTKQLAEDLAREELDGDVFSRRSEHELFLRLDSDSPHYQQFLREYDAALIPAKANKELKERKNRLLREMDSAEVHLSFTCKQYENVRDQLNDKGHAHWAKEIDVAKARVHSLKQEYAAITEEHKP